MDLENVTIGDDFTLFSRSSQLVDQKTWYDENDVVVSDFYLMGFESEDRTYYTSPRS